MKILKIMLGVVTMFISIFVAFFKISDVKAQTYTDQL